MASRAARRLRTGLALLSAGSAWVGMGVLLAVLLVLPAAMFWLGVSVALGRGDSTWNDGEEYWATAVGTGLSAVVVALVALAAAWRCRRRGETIDVWRALALGLPPLGVEVAIAVAFVGGGAIA